MKNVKSLSAHFSKATLSFALIVSAWFVHAHDEGRMEKPGANVAFSHNYDGRSDIGELEQLLLTFRKAEDILKFDVKIHTPAGLQIQKGDFDAHTSSLPLQVTAVQNGKHYIGIHVSTVDTSGRELRRVFELPIQVGPVQVGLIQAGKTLAQQKTQKHHSERQGRKVVILESSERQ